MRSYYRRISKHHMLLPNLGRFKRLLLPVAISKHHMLLPNIPHTLWMPVSHDFKTSYVITKPVQFLDISSSSIFQNIICYYQTLPDMDVLYPSPISKHHMLLPNKGKGYARRSAPYFKTSYVITKLTVLSHPSIR